MKKAVIYFVLLLGAKALAVGGVTIGNGGDSIAQEFTRLGRIAAELLQQGTTSVLSQSQKDRFSEVVQKTRVTTKDAVFLNNAEVDAINYPSEYKIEVSRSRWNDQGDRKSERRLMLVLHEYLWVSGVDDSAYTVSTALYEDLKKMKQNSAKSPKTLTCFAMVLKARDFLNDSPEIDTWSKEYVLKLAKDDSTTEMSGKVNGESTRIMGALDTRSNSIELTFQIGESSIDIVSDNLLVDNSFNDENGIRRTSYRYARGTNGMLKLSQGFLKYLENSGRLNQSRSLEGNLSVSVTERIADDVKQALAQKKMEENDVIGFGTWKQCTLF